LSAKASREQPSTFEKEKPLDVYLSHSHIEFSSFPNQKTRVEPEYFKPTETLHSLFANLFFMSFFRTWCPEFKFLSILKEELLSGTKFTEKLKVL
jgi:hypothetical protein